MPRRQERKLIDLGSKNPRRQRLSKGNRHSEEEKRRLLAEFSKALEAGMTAEEAARIVNISPATYYRWHRASGASCEPERIISIESVIEDLTRCDVTSAELRRAVFLFSLWLSDPGNALSLRASLPCFVFAYWNAKFPSRLVSELPAEVIQEINQLLRLEDCLLAYDVELDVGHHGEELPLTAESFTLRQVVAEWASYFVSASLEGVPVNKETLQNVIFHKGFKYKWDCSSSTLNGIWAKRVSSFPFLYIQEYHSPLNWSLSPKNGNFSVEVDLLCEKYDSRLEYFGRCKWAISVLRKSACRAIKTTLFPTLPASLPSISCASIALTSPMIAASREPRYEHTEESLDHELWKESAKIRSKFNRLVRQ